MNMKFKRIVSLIMVLMLVLSTASSFGGVAASDCKANNCSRCKGTGSLSCMPHNQFGKCQTCGLTDSKVAGKITCPGICTELAASSSTTKRCGANKKADGSCTNQSNHVSPCNICSGYLVNGQCINKASHNASPVIHMEYDIPEPQKQNIMSLNVNAPAAPAANTAIMCNTDYAIKNPTVIDTATGKTYQDGYHYRQRTEGQYIHIDENGIPVTTEQDHNGVGVLEYIETNPQGVPYKKGADGKRGGLWAPNNGRDHFTAAEWVEIQQSDDTFFVKTNSFDPKRPNVILCNDITTSLFEQNICESAPSHVLLCILPLKELDSLSNPLDCNGVYVEGGVPDSCTNEEKHQAYQCTRRRLTKKAYALLASGVHLGYNSSSLEDCDSTVEPGSKTCGGADKHAYLCTGKTGNNVQCSGVLIEKTLLCSNVEIPHTVKGCIEWAAYGNEPCPIVQPCTGMVDSKGTCSNILNHAKRCGLPAYPSKGSKVVIACSGVYKIIGTAYLKDPEDCTNNKLHISGADLPGGGGGTSTSPGSSGGAGNGTGTKCAATMKGLGAAPQFGIAPCSGDVTADKGCSNKANHAISCPSFLDVAKTLRCNGAIPAADSGQPVLCSNEKAHYLEPAKCTALIAGDIPGLQQGTKTCSGTMINKDTRTCSNRETHVSICGEILDPITNQACQGALPALESGKSRVCPNILNHYFSKPLTYDPRSESLKDASNYSSAGLTTVQFGTEALGITVTDSSGKAATFDQLIAKDQYDDVNLTLLPSMTDGVTRLNIAQKDVKKLENAGVNYIVIDLGESRARVPVEVFDDSSLSKIARKLGVTLSQTKIQFNFTEVPLSTSAVKKGIGKKTVQSSCVQATAYMVIPGNKKTNISSIFDSGVELTLNAEKHLKSTAMYSISAKGKAAKLTSTKFKESDTAFVRSWVTPGSYYVVLK